MDLRLAICYVSNASDTLSEEEIQKMLSEFEKKNEKKDITGILLYSERNFFQVIEGEKNYVNDLFEKIKVDKRHKNLMTIFKKDITKSEHDGYKSDFKSGVNVNKKELKQRYEPYLHILDTSTRKVVDKMVKVFFSSN